MRLAGQQLGLRAGWLESTPARGARPVALEQLRPDLLGTKFDADGADPHARIGANFHFRGS
jgi:hypothetical protein